MNIQTHAVSMLAVVLFIALAAVLMSAVRTADDGVGTFPGQVGPATVTSLY